MTAEPINAKATDEEDTASARVAARNVLSAAMLFQDIEGKVVVWRTRRPGNILAQDLLDRGASLVIFLDEGEDMEVLNDDEMRSHGWVRVPTASDGQFGGSGMVVNVTGIDPEFALHFELAELRAQVERLQTALRYIERPTMGLTDEDPEMFAMEQATDENARLALATCIRTARQALHG